METDHTFPKFSQQDKRLGKLNLLIVDDMTKQMNDSVGTKKCLNMIKGTNK